MILTVTLCVTRGGPVIDTRRTRYSARRTVTDPLQRAADRYRYAVDPPQRPAIDGPPAQHPCPDQTRSVARLGRRRRQPAAGRRRRGAGIASFGEGERRDGPGAGTRGAGAPGGRRLALGPGRPGPGRPGPGRLQVLRPGRWTGTPHAAARRPPACGRATAGTRQRVPSPRPRRPSPAADPRLPPTGFKLRPTPGCRQQASSSGRLPAASNRPQAPTDPRLPPTGFKFRPAPGCELGRGGVRAGGRAGAGAGGLAEVKVGLEHAVSHVTVRRDRAP
jgi:hypothetical protein